MWYTWQPQETHWPQLQVFYLCKTYIYTPTCDVYNKSLRISLQLKDLPHTPQVNGHSLQHMYWCSVSLLNSHPFCFKILALIYIKSNMFLTSRTSFSLLQSKA
jgi:hypothetical protein